MRERVGALILWTLMAGCASAPARGTNAKPPQRAITLATDGWQLFQERWFVSDFGGGHYTEPDPATRVRDFWSNGVLAKVDAGDDGHFESIFRIDNGQPRYVGELGRKGRFVRTAPGFAHMLGKTLAQSDL